MELNPSQLQDLLDVLNFQKEVRARVEPTMAEKRYEAKYKNIRQFINPSNRKGELTDQVKWEVWKSNKNTPLKAYTPGLPSTEPEIEEFFQAYLEILEETGLDPNEPLYSDASWFEHKEDRGDIKSDIPPLYLAALFRNKDVYEKLLQKGADPAKESSTHTKAWNGREHTNMQSTIQLVVSMLDIELLKITLQTKSEKKLKRATIIDTVDMAKDPGMQRFVPTLFENGTSTTYQQSREANKGKAISARGINHSIYSSPKEQETKAQMIKLLSCEITKKSIMKVSQSLELEI